MAHIDTADTSALRQDNILSAAPEAVQSDESRQSALVALGRRAVASSDTLLLMQDAASLLAETLDADFSSVAELVPDGNAFHVRLSNTNGAPPFTYQTGIGETESLAGYALGIGHPVIIADLANDPRAVDARLSREGIRSAIVCPLRLNEQAFGALGVYLTTPRRFAASDVLFVETISHLITTTIAREHSERQLAAERAFAATILETVEALVLVLNPAGRLMRLNRAAERITGFSNDEVWDRPVFNALVVPEEVELIRGAFEKLLRGQSPVAFDSSILTKQGDRRKIAWSFSTQRDPQGAIAAVVGTGIDISEKFAAETLLTEARAAVTRAEEQNQQLSCELEQARGQSSARTADPKSGLRPFQQLKDEPGSDRRQKPRRAYPYIQLIAPMRGNKLPSRAAFGEVLCHDISASGFSFFSTRPPESEFLVVAFGTRATFTYLKAHVVHCRRTEDSSQFLVGCHYTGRVEY